MATTLRTNNSRHILLGDRRCSVSDKTQELHMRAIITSDVKPDSNKLLFISTPEITHYSTPPTPYNRTHNGQL